MSTPRRPRRRSERCWCNSRATAELELTVGGGDNLADGEEYVARFPVCTAHRSLQTWPWPVMDLARSEALGHGERRMLEPEEQWWDRDEPQTRGLPN